MSLQKTSSGRTRRVRFAALLLSTLVVAAACNDGALFSPNKEPHNVSLQIRPYFAALDGMSSMSADINVVRLTIKQQPAGTIVLQQEFNVDPSAGEWNLPVDVPPNSDLDILIELINKVGPTETTVYSGTLQVKVTSGPQTPPPPVPVFPGPPENLTVNSIAISPRDQNVLEGDKVQLTAKVDGPSGAKVQWISLNSAVATVDSLGNVTTNSPGTAVITAIAGPKQDAVTFTVGARATQVQVAPGTSTLVALGSDATFTGKVLDKRNSEMVLPLTWSVADTTVVKQISAGVFRARKNGTTSVTASATQAGKTLTATATVTVQQQAVTVSVTPGSTSFDALGNTATFTAQGKDSNGNDVPSVAFAWKSDNPSVATVDANGKVTAVGNGAANISATAGGSSASAGVTVNQVAKSLSVSPGSLKFTYLGQTLKITATVKDANGYAMPAGTLAWGSTAPTVAFVNSSGEVNSVKTGGTMITVRAGLMQTNIPTTVTQAAAQITLDVYNATIGVGGSLQLHWSGVDAGGSAITTPALEWVSDNPNVATVTSSGLVRGVAAGTAQIVGTSGLTTTGMRVTVSGTNAGILRPNRNGKVLVLGADYDTYTVASSLVSTGLFASSDVSTGSMNNCAPMTQSELGQYGAILAYTNYKPCNAVMWGDALKSYVDAGGKVVLMVYAFTKGLNGYGDWALEGGIMSHNYSPFELGYISLIGDGSSVPSYYTFYGRTLNFATAATTSPILQGVSEFTYDGNYNTTLVTVDTGAVLIARDNANLPLIAVNSMGSVVAFNVFPGSFNKSAGVWKAFANALK